MTDKILPARRTALIDITFSVVDNIRRTRFFNEKTSFKLDNAVNFSSGQTILVAGAPVGFTISGATQFVLVYSYQPFLYDLTIGLETIHGVTCSGTLLLANPVTTLVLRAPPGQDVRIEYGYS